MDETNTKKQIDKKLVFKRLYWVAILLLSFATIIGVMLSFYDGSPILNEDGTITVNPNRIWDLDNFGMFFLQIYGTSLTLGFSMFVLAIGSIIAMVTLSKLNENKYSLKTNISFVVITIVGMVLAATPFIFLISGLMVVMGLIYLFLSLFTNIFYDENNQQKVEEVNK